MIVFVFGAYPITNYIYRPIYEISQSNEVLEYWDNWYLICLFIGFSMPISILLKLLTKNLPIEKSILILVLILMIGNIIDRAIFNVKTFQSNDIFFILLSIIVSSFIYFKNKKYVKNHLHK